LDLLLQIEDIIEKKGSDFELSKLFKQYIKEYKESLPEIFEQNQGKDFLVRHTKKLDSIITLMYKTILRRMFGNYLPMKSSIPIAIVALGSYGREQLCVHSDIDLLIVYEDIEGYNTQLIIEKLFYLALDAGMKLGHRVHEVKDLFKASNEDITIKTSLMESRFITGSTFIWHSTQRELNKIRTYKQKDFILAKIDEAHARRKKNPSSMEPNIKESVGGLRDAQLIFWVAKTIYGVNNVKELSGNVFSDESYKEFRIALELIYRVRSALHLIANKQEDKLLLEYIPQITKLLGFKNQIKTASKVLEAQWRINNFTQIFVKKMTRNLIANKTHIKELRKNRIQKGISILKDRVIASYNMKTLPLNKILEILVNLEDKPHKFDSGFLAQLTYTKISHPLKDKTYILLKKLFLKKHLYPFLRLFYDAGVLHQLFPIFRKVMYMPQFDGYHTFPVDIHSIKCVEALENIQENFIKDLYDNLSTNEKLLIKSVVLFHDTGKGRKQDHSEVGAKLIAAFSKQIGLSQEDTKRAVTLVKNHVLMSSVAFKENIHNEKTLYGFISKIDDKKNLDLLYILTYADINGVSNETFNSFNSKLIYDLYNNALEVVENTERITDAKKRLIIINKVKKEEDFKKLTKLRQKKILTIESNLFFFKNQPSEILEIAKIANEIQEYDFKIKNKNNLTIEIYRKIPINIGYLLSALAPLNVVNMEIFTLFNEVKYFRIDFLKNVGGNELIEVQEIIDSSFDMKKDVFLRDVEIKKDEISLDCEHSMTHAELSINTKNQKGLLSYIMDCLEKLNINIVTAKIHSSKYKARDSFLMEKQNNICDNGEEIFKLLTKGS